MRPIQCEGTQSPPQNPSPALILELLRQFISMANYAQGPISELSSDLLKDIPMQVCAFLCMKCLMK